jgi:hypothetical protein
LPLKRISHEHEWGRRHGQALGTPDRASLDRYCFPCGRDRVCQRDPEYRRSFFISSGFQYDDFRYIDSHDRLFVNSDTGRNAHSGINRQAGIYDNSTAHSCNSGGFDCDPIELVYAGRNASFDGDSISNIVPPTYVHSIANINIYVNTYVHSNTTTYANTDSNSIANTNIYANTNTNPYTNTNIYANTNTNIYANTNTNIYANTNTNIYANSIANPYTNTNIYANSITNIYANSIANPYTNTNIYANSITNIYANTDSNTNIYANFDINSDRIRLIFTPRAMDFLR